MSRATLEKGEVVDLEPYYENLNRRDFLKKGVYAASGIISLSTIIERAYGATPEGSTIVQTRDLKGRPSKVKVVEPERKRRIQLYSNMDTSPLVSKRPTVMGITLDQSSRDPTDLNLEILVRKKEKQSRGLQRVSDIEGSIVGTHSIGKDRKITDPEMSTDKLQKTADRMEVKYKVASYQNELLSLEGGEKLNNPGSPSYGTCFIVGEGNGEDLILTAEHVTDATSDLEWEGQNIGTIVESSGQGKYGMDVVAFRAEGVSVNTDGIVDIKDANGYWTFEGLADETAGWIIEENTLDVKCHGATSGTFEDTCMGTSRNTDLSHRCRYEKNPTASGGDSGSPFIDEDGNLVSHLAGTYGPAGWSRTYGGVAGPLLDEVNANLSG